MIKIYNTAIPFDGYLALTVWPLLFIRSDVKKKFDEIDENHENIHGRQQLEFLAACAVLMAVIIPLSGISWWWMCACPGVYFMWYGLEYCIRYVAYPSQNDAYYNISFEQEAYQNEKDLGYLKKRRPFAWAKYLFRKTYDGKAERMKRINEILNQDNF